MVLHFGKNNIKLYRVVDKNGNYLRGYGTTQSPKEATLYEERMAKIICDDDTPQRKWKVEPVSVTITVKDETKNGKEK